MFFNKCEEEKRLLEALLGSELDNVKFKEKRDR